MTYGDKVNKSSQRRAYEESKEKASKNPVAYFIGLCAGLALMASLLGGLIWVNVQIWSAIF